VVTGNADIAGAEGEAIIGAAIGAVKRGRFGFAGGLAVGGIEDFDLDVVAVVRHGGT